MRNLYVRNRRPWSWFRESNRIMEVLNQIKGKVVLVREGAGVHFQGRLQCTESNWQAVNDRTAEAVHIEPDLVEIITHTWNFNYIYMRKVG